MIVKFGNSIRQVAQGIQSFGIAFSIFVSAPLAKMLHSVVNEAVDFDDAMNRVQKVTGASNDEITALGDSLGQSSLMLVNSRSELAKFAEDWGALGVRISSTADAAMMSGLVEWTSKLVMSAENLTAADVVEKLGKAIILYFPDISEFDKVKDGIGSVILALEDANSIGASDILATFQRMAPIAQQMGIDMVSALTMSASAAAGIASAERAGTELAAALQKVSINTEKAAEATGMHESAIIDMINTDAEGYILGMAYSIAQMTDNVAQQNALFEQFGTTGGKAIAALVSSWSNLEKNISVANRAFLEGTYLQVQYAQSLESSRVQLKILGNNITYLGSTIGDALLPYITKFVTLAVPAIQMLATWFKSLGESVKIQTVAWIAFLAIAGPIVVFFSSLLFMVGLGISGLASMVGVVGSLISGFFSIGGAIAGLLNPLTALAAALVGGAIYAAYLVADLNASENVITSFISSAYNWGHSLVSSLAEGIYSAASAAYNALVSVINSFIGLIQSFSPPKEGPLKDIGTWGHNLIVAYADGMVSASNVVDDAATVIDERLKGILGSLSIVNLGMFDDIFGKIQAAISAVGRGLGLGQNEIETNIKSAADALANFMSNLQDGIPDDIKELFGMLGGLGGDFENLISLQIKYADGANRLKQIENALKNIGSETEGLIANIVKQDGLTDDQQSAMIRRVKLEQSLKKQQLETEQSNLTREQEKLKEDIDKKQKIIDILLSVIKDAEKVQSQPDVPTDKPPKDPKADNITPIDYQKFDELGSKVEDVGRKFETTSNSTKTFTEKLGSAKLMIEGFVAAIRGDKKEDWGTQPKEFWKGWESGSAVKKSIDDFFIKFDGFVTKLSGYRDIIKDVGLKFLLGLGEGSSTGKLNWEAVGYMGTLAAAAFVLGSVLGIVGGYIKSGFDAIFTDPDGKAKEKSPFETAIDRILEGYKAFKDGWTETTKDIDWEVVGTNLRTISTGLTLVLTSKELWNLIGKIIGSIAKVATEMISGLAELTLIIGAIFGSDDKKQFEDLYASLATNEEEAKKFKKAGADAYQTWHNFGMFIRSTKTDYDNLSGSISTLWKKATEDAEKNGIGSGIKTFLLDPITKGFDDFTKTIEDWFLNNKWSPLNWGKTLFGFDQGATDIINNQTPDKKESGSGGSGGGSGGFGDAGAANAKSLIQGFTDYMTGKNGQTSVSEAITTGLNGSTIMSSEKVIKSGEFTGADYLWGLGQWFFNQDNTGTTMDELPTAVDVWSKNKKDVIVEKGTFFGTDLLSGLGALFFNQEEPNRAMDKLPPAIDIWNTA